MTEKRIRVLFVIAGLYDGFLGLAFLFYPGEIFALHGVEPPNHMAYVQFPALLLLVFAVMFFRIAVNPIRNAELILYGCGLKFSYCVIAFWYELTRDIPFMWIPWAWADFIFFILFVLAWRSIGGFAKAS